MTVAVQTEGAKRRTFAIISHPDAGKTTLTEKLLLYGGAIQMAGTVKGRKASRHATSDWMALEKQRGISVTTSVMQFPYKNCIINLLDTPGHEDFSEDTYRTLSAVDCALMVIDAAKGVEPRTIKLMEVCRLRDTPIITFINKLDREGREPIELLDEIEKILKLSCAVMTYPVGQGKHFHGVYHRERKHILLFEPGHGESINEAKILEEKNPEALRAKFQWVADEFLNGLELVEGASADFDKALFLQGKLSPVYFGSALQNFGIREILDALIEYAPSPQSTESMTREVLPSEPSFSGFVFKIQANMDPQHRDRIAFMRIISGHYRKGMRLFHVRTKRELLNQQALTFMAGSRDRVEDAWPGDIIGLTNHGTIQIGDTFTEGENLKFPGVPHFAPELFKAVRAKDPLKSKALTKGLVQLCEEGATQVFRPINQNTIVLGAVGVLQFDVVAFRLESEYNVACIYDAVTIATVRWVRSDNSAKLEEFKHKCQDHLALDHQDKLVYLAPSTVNLHLTQERWRDIVFEDTSEIGHAG